MGDDIMIALVQFSESFEVNADLMDGGEEGELEDSQHWELIQQQFLRGYLEDICNPLEGRGGEGRGGGGEGRGGEGRGREGK